DIIVPLETLAGNGFEVLGGAEVDGRPAYRLQLDYRQAVPLIASLQAGGAWREFHPLDQVELWIDTETWFPLRFEVIAGTSQDRPMWATRRGLNDRPGTTLLSVHTTGFSEPQTFPRGTFRVPSTGISRDGGFSPRSSSTGVVPGFVAGLEPYRSGTTGEGGLVNTFSNGMEYLKMTTRKGPLSEEALRSGEEIDLDRGSFVYYLPASQAIGRRLEIAGRRYTIQMQTNLSRDTLLRVAGSIDIRGRRAPKLIDKSAGLSVKRVDPSKTPPAFAVAPTYLPPGYVPATASVAVTRGGAKTHTVYYRRTEGEFDGLGIRIVQSSSVEFLPPSSEDFVEIRLSSASARWSAERGELEWLEGHRYRAVAVPSADLYTAVRIAEGLR
ncbi:MAG: hypothetical protein LC808_18825, partial [Actinobacteria bacterium]|nr:hypothetical protein [Actinomycetota bacterium]